MTEQADVNPVAETSEVESSPTEGQEPTPAEAQNTEGSQIETEQGPIPYSRFKEINDKAKDLQTKYEALKGFEGKQDLLSAYQQFDEVLSQNPQLLEAVMGAMKQAQAGQSGQAQTPDTAQQLVLNNYLQVFDDFCEKEGIPEDSKDLIRSLAGAELSKRNPNYLVNYDLKAVKDSLTATKEKLDQLWKQKQSSYIEAKKKDVVPTSATRGGGSPAPAQRKLSTQQDRASYMAEMLRAGQ